MASILFESASFQEHENISGVGYYAQTLASELSRRHEVSLASGPFGANTVFNKIYRKAASHRLAFPLDMNRQRYDLALFPNFASLPTTKAKKRAVVVHDLTYLRYPESVEAKNLAYLRRVVPRSIANCDYVITVSESVKQEVIDEFSVADRSIIVTPIPPRKEVIEGSRGNEIHNKYGIPTEKFLLFVGNLEPRKNVNFIIDAYLNLPDDLKGKYSLILGGGTGWGSDATRQRVAELKNTTNIRHIGYIDDEDLSTVYSKADIFLFASLYEGFGMPILESIACGTPVISSSIPVFKEILDDSGLYTETPLEMSQKIVSLCTREGSINNLLTKQSAVLEKYSWEKNIDHIDEIIQQA